MLKVVLLVALACTCSKAYDVEGMSKTNLSQFLSGTLTGLSAGPSSVCGQSIKTIVNAYLKVVADVKIQDPTLQDVINTLNQMQAVVNSLGSLKKCNFGELDNQLLKVFSKGGPEMVINNYLANGAAIFSDYHVVETCNTNYTTCGQAYGNMFKLLVGWSLN
jgi:hypothetical protein